MDVPYRRAIHDDLRPTTEGDCDLGFESAWISVQVEGQASTLVGLALVVVVPAALRSRNRRPTGTLKRSRGAAPSGV